MDAKIAEKRIETKVKAIWSSSRPPRPSNHRVAFQTPSFQIARKRFDPSGETDMIESNEVD
jgi:hypothetical protein